MLEKLLAELRANPGPLDTTRLAAKLDTSPQMVAVLLEHLSRAGYLQPYAACIDGCAGCGLRQACQLPVDSRSETQTAVRLWQLDHK
jgi:hypothetical protein